MDHEIVTAQACCIKNTSQPNEPTWRLLKDGECLPPLIQYEQCNTDRKVKCRSELMLSLHVGIYSSSLLSHSALQDFEWMTSREAGGARTKIISTFDASYSHSSVSKRVASGDISVVRLKDNEVELKIAEVKSQDAGLYWCQTPSTDSVISGNYEAQVQLIGERSAEIILVPPCGYGASFSSYPHDSHTLTHSCCFKTIAGM